MSAVQVLDAEGRRLSPCSREKAARLVAEGQAEWLGDQGAAIRLQRVVRLPEPPPPEVHPLAGQRVLLHVCCAPCSTYTLQRLRALGAQVTGFWYNPNVHPFGEHERRREALADYAQKVGLPMMWERGYEMVAYMRAICGREEQGARCAICYRLRLERTALVAAQQGYALITTTLLISPYQDLEEIGRIGHERAAAHGVAFCQENLCSGFGEHHRLAREHGLYQQRYCGCLYSEWEAHDPEATTRRRRPAEPDAAG